MTAKVRIKIRTFADRNHILLTNLISISIMKGMKFSAIVLSASLILSSCNMSNMAKGGLIGGTSGGAVGALVGQLIGKGKGAAIGAAVGATVGTGAGLLIGKKMDKAKAAAEAAKAQAEILTAADGTLPSRAASSSPLARPNSPLPPRAKSTSSSPTSRPRIALSTSLS